MFWAIILPGQKVFNRFEGKPQTAAYAKRFKLSGGNEFPKGSAADFENLAGFFNVENKLG